jgi:hypothetical protein
MRFGNNQLLTGIGGFALNAHSTGIARFNLNLGDLNMVADAPEMNGINGNLITTSSDFEILHTAPAYAMDEIYIWAHNYDSSDRYLYLADVWSKVATAPVKITISSRVGLTLVVPGFVLGGGSQTTSLYGKASGGGIDIVGFALRRYQRDPNDPSMGYHNS